jgi:hypothetical protein
MLPLVTWCTPCVGRRPFALICVYPTEPEHCCRFIKEFDNKPPDPEQDSQRVQVTSCVPEHQEYGSIGERMQCKESVSAGADLGPSDEQDFLLKSEAAFKSHPVWASSPGEHQQQAIEVGASQAVFCMVLHALVLHVLFSPIAQHSACLQPQGLEKYLMTKLYGKVFAASQSDRERDEALAQRMEVRISQCS